MHKCKCCSKKFKWKEIIKSIWLGGYKPIVCVNCNTKHFINSTTKLIISLSTFFPLIANNLVNLYFENNFKYFIILYLIWIIIVICITPCFARYHTKTNDVYDDGTKALLVSGLNSVEAEIVSSILESYEIPYFNKSSGIGGYMEIMSGVNNCGIDVYVQPHMLQTAKELINPNNIQDNIN